VITYDTGGSWLLLIDKTFSYDHMKKTTDATRKQQAAGRQEGGNLNASCVVSKMSNRHRCLPTSHDPEVCWDH